MVPREDDVDADLLDGGERATDVAVGRVLGLELDADPGASRASATAALEARCLAQGTTFSPLPMTTTPFSVTS